MKKILKNFTDFIYLLLIFIIILGYCLIKYTIYKNKQETLKPYKEILTSQTTEEINSQKSTLWPRIKDFTKGKLKVDDNKKNNYYKDTTNNNSFANLYTNSELNSNLKSSSNDNTNTLIHFNVPSEADSFIFDDALLMYEGEQKGGNVKSLLNRMIETAEDVYFSNTILTVKNIGNIDKTVLDDSNYKANIIEIKNNINENDIYNVYFGYNKLKSCVNEIIIEKK